jgi:hypothetical protein
VAKALIRNKFARYVVSTAPVNLDEGITVPLVPTSANINTEVRTTSIDRTW